MELLPLAAVCSATDEHRRSVMARLPTFDIPVTTRVNWRLRAAIMGHPNFIAVHHALRHVATAWQFVTSDSAGQFALRQALDSLTAALYIHWRPFLTSASFDKGRPFVVLMKTALESIEEHIGPQSLGVLFQHWATAVFNSRMPPNVLLHPSDGESVVGEKSVFDFTAFVEGATPNWLIEIANIDAEQVSGQFTTAPPEPPMWLLMARNRQQALDAPGVQPLSGVIPAPLAMPPEMNYVMPGMKVLRHPVPAPEQETALEQARQLGLRHTDPAPQAAKPVSAQQSSPTVSYSDKQVQVAATLQASATQFVPSSTASATQTTPQLADAATATEAALIPSTLPSTAGLHQDFPDFADLVATVPEYECRSVELPVAVTVHDLLAITAHYMDEDPPDDLTQQTPEHLADKTRKAFVLEGALIAILDRVDGNPREALRFLYEHYEELFPAPESRSPSPARPCSPTSVDTSEVESVFQPLTCVPLETLRNVAERMPTIPVYTPDNNDSKIYSLLCICTRGIERCVNAEAATPKERLASIDSWMTIPEDCDPRNPHGLDLPPNFTEHINTTFELTGDILHAIRHDLKQLPKLITEYYKRSIPELRKYCEAPTPYPSPDAIDQPLQFPCNLGITSTPFELQTNLYRYRQTPTETVVRAPSVEAFNNILRRTEHQASVRDHRLSQDTERLTSRHQLRVIDMAEYGAYPLEYSRRHSAHVRDPRERESLGLGPLPPYVHTLQDLILLQMHYSGSSFQYRFTMETRPKCVVGNAPTLSCLSPYRAPHHARPEQPEEQVRESCRPPPSSTPDQPPDLTIDIPDEGDWQSRADNPPQLTPQAPIASPITEPPGNNS